MSEMLKIDMNYRSVTVVQNARNPALPKLRADINSDGLVRYQRLDGARGQVDAKRFRKPVYKLLAEIKFVYNVTDQEVKDHYHRELKGRI